MAADAAMLGDIEASAARRRRSHTPARRRPGEEAEEGPRRVTDRAVDPPVDPRHSA